MNGFLLSRWLVAAALPLLSLMPSRAAPPAVREMTAEHRWLNFPLSDTAPLHQVEILAGGKRVRLFAAQLVAGEPGWWSSLDIGAWKGAGLQVRLVDAGADPSLLAAIDESDQSKDGGPALYQESLRPQFHFSARRGWLNDPNGLVFCDGRYHLFFQHNPFAWLSSSKHWGHAVSADLVHWHELAEALYPDEQGQMYSGSAVVDRANSSGLVDGAKTPLVLVYTNAGQVAQQCLASTEDGVTFQKFVGNPILPPILTQNRDPRAFWYAPTKSWVLALYVGTPDPLKPDKPHDNHDHHSIHLYVSTNLRDWRLTQVIEGGSGGKDNFLYECPDLFPLRVEGSSAPAKWILQGASSEYEIGRFDGTKFTPESPRLRDRFGKDFYAAQTFNNVPDGRMVQIGWMRAATPGMPFNQFMSIPLDLSLKHTPQGLRLAYAPVPELKALRGTPVTVPPGNLAPQENALASVKGDALDLEAELRPGAARSLVFQFRGVPVTYDVAAGVLHVQKFSAPVPLENGVLRLRILLDRTTLDIFAANGTVYLPLAILPAPTDLSLSLTADGGGAEIVSLKTFPMKSSWLQ